MLPGLAPGVYTALTILSQFAFPTRPPGFEVSSLDMLIPAQVPSGFHLGESHLLTQMTSWGWLLAGLPAGAQVLILQG